MGKSFKQRVVKFWLEFAQKEAEVRSMMDNKVEGETLLEFVGHILDIAFEKVCFEMRINNENKYELILTPEGDKVRLLQLKYWQQMAPQSLSDKWNFYSSNPSSDSSSLLMFDIDLTLDDVILYPEIDEDKHKINIDVYAPKIIDLDEDKRYSMFFIFLDRFISELYTMEYIGYIHFTDEENEDEGIDMLKLKNLIDKNIVEKEWINPEDIGHTYTSYKMNPSQSPDRHLREDIVIGITTCFDVLNGFYSKTDELVKEYEKDGLTFGFLFYENIKIPQKEIVGVRGEIEDKILEKAENLHIANTLGGATGERFSYMDFIIYDLEAFLEIAKEVLSGYQFEETGFSKFVFADKPILFTK